MNAYNVLMVENLTGLTELCGVAYGDDPIGQFERIRRENPDSWPTQVRGQTVHYRVDLNSARQIADDCPAAVQHNRLMAHWESKDAGLKSLES